MKPNFVIPSPARNPLSAGSAIDPIVRHNYLPARGINTSTGGFTPYTPAKLP